MPAIVSPTPILDLEQDPPPVHRWTAKRVLGAAAGTAFVLLPMILPSVVPGVPGFNVFLWFPAIYAAITIHELGHLTFGKMNGMAPGGISVGGFTFRKSGERWIYSFDGRQFLAGGSAMPLAGSAFHRNAFAWMVAGGPIATVCFVLLLLLAWHLMGDGRIGWVGTLFWGSTLPLTSLIPFRAPDNLSDAGRLWELFRRPERSRRWIALLDMAAQEIRGVLPRDWSSAAFEQTLQAEPPESIFMIVHLFAYYRKIDLGDEMGAIVHLENALSAPSLGRMENRRAMFLEAAFSSARRCANPVNARVWLDRAEKLDKRHKIKSTEATQGAIAMAERRFSDAISHWQGASRFLIDKKLDGGLARFCQLKYREYEAECRAALESSTDFASVVEAKATPPEPAPVKKKQTFPWMSVTMLAILATIILVMIFR